MEALHQRTEQARIFSEARINFITFTYIMNSHIGSFISYFIYGYTRRIGSGSLILVKCGAVVLLFFLPDLDKLRY